MKLKYIVPDMAQTFGNLEFAGENDVEQQRVNGRFVLEFQSCSAVLLPLC